MTFACCIHMENKNEDVPLMEVMYLVFTRTPDESYRRRLRSLLLYLCCVFRVQINSIVFYCLFVFLFYERLLSS